MKSSTVLRLCLVFGWVFFLLSIVASIVLESSLPEPLRAWSKASSEHWATGKIVLCAVGIPLYVSCIVATMGLLDMRRWAAWLYLITIGISMAPFTGPSVEFALTNTLGGIGLVLCGMVIALAFFTDSLTKQAAEQDPSPLCQWLGYGILGALTVGLLVACSALFVLTGWDQSRLAIFFVFLAMPLPLGVMLKAYWHVSLQTQEHGLRMSMLSFFCIFIVTILIIAYSAGASTTNGDWNIVIWTVLAMAIPTLLVLVLVLASMKQDARGWTSVVFDMIAYTVLIAFGIVVIWAKYAKKSLNWDLIMGLGVILLILFLLGSLVWFAVAKIRLRKVLGTLASVIGSVELLMILLGALALGGAILDKPQALIVISVFVASILWAFLTAGMFLNYRNRLMCLASSQMDIKSDN